MGPEVRREKRYAQCHFVDMRALKRFMLDHVRLRFYNFAKPKTIDANMKSLKKHWKKLLECLPSLYGINKMKH